jgi:hypothetical protein
MKPFSVIVHAMPFHNAALGPVRISRNPTLISLIAIINPVKEITRFRVFFR